MYAARLAPNRALNSRVEHIRAGHSGFGVLLQRGAHPPSVLCHLTNAWSTAPSQENPTSLHHCLNLPSRCVLQAGSLGERLVQSGAARPLMLNLTMGRREALTGRDVQGFGCLPVIRRSDWMTHVSLVNKHKRCPEPCHTISSKHVEGPPY